MSKWEVTVTFRRKATYLVNATSAEMAAEIAEWEIKDGNQGTTVESRHDKIRPANVRRCRSPRLTSV